MKKEATFPRVWDLVWILLLPASEKQEQHPSLKTNQQAWESFSLDGDRDEGEHNLKKKKKTFQFFPGISMSHQYFPMSWKCLCGSL